MKSTNIALVSIIGLMCINSHTHMDKQTKRKWNIQPKEQHSQMVSDQWKAFFKNYGFKTAVGTLTGTACGVSCAFFEKQLRKGNISFISWFIFWLIKSGSVSRITQEMKEHGIEDKNRLVGISATIGSWGSYLLFKWLVK